MLHDSFMSRANTIVVPGGKMELAMQLIFTPIIWRMMERRKRALGALICRRPTMSSNSTDRVIRAGNGATRRDGQRAPRARDGRGGAGQLRPPRRADGHGRDRRGAVEPPPAHNPANPQWADRDRFVLSNGHGSMLLYALLHLTGYDLPIDELKRFRQLHSKTPGHPEVGVDAGRGDHHRPARPGPRQRGRHGAGREAAGRRVQPARATPSSTTAPTSSSATAA